MTRRTYKPYTGLKVFATVVSLLLIAAIIFGIVGYNTGLIQFGTSEEIVEQDGTDENNDGMVVETAEEYGISVMATKLSEAQYDEYGINPLAVSAYDLTATLSPSNVTNKTINWSIAFVNANSEWANGKTVTDYVTLNATTSISGDSVAVTCLQDFGEQIIITASAADSSDVYATCTVDYMQRLNYFSYVMTVSNGSSTRTYNDTSDDGESIEGSTLYGYDGYYISFNITPTYSNYTLEDTYTYTISVNGDNNFASSYLNTSYSSVEYSLDAFSGNVTVADLFKAVYGCDASDYEDIYTLLKNAKSAEYYQLYFGITIAGSYSSVYCGYSMYISADLFKAAATAVDLSLGSIIF